MKIDKMPELVINDDNPPIFGCNTTFTKKYEKYFPKSKIITSNSYFMKISEKFLHKFLKSGHPYGLYDLKQMNVVAEDKIQEKELKKCLEDLGRFITYSTIHEIMHGLAYEKVYLSKDWYKGYSTLEKAKEQLKKGVLTNESYLIKLKRETEAIFATKILLDKLPSLNTISKKNFLRGVSEYFNLELKDVKADFLDQTNTFAQLEKEAITSALLNKELDNQIYQDLLIELHEIYKDSKNYCAPIPHENKYVKCPKTWVGYERGHHKSIATKLCAKYNLSSEKTIQISDGLEYLFKQPELDKSFLNNQFTFICKLSHALPYTLASYTKISKNDFNILFENGDIEYTLDKFYNKLFQK
jgi:hypothetical protein